MTPFDCLIVSAWASTYVWLYTVWEGVPTFGIFASKIQVSVHDVPERHSADGRCMRWARGARLPASTSRNSMTIGEDALCSSEFANRPTFTTTYDPRAHLRRTVSCVLFFNDAISSNPSVVHTTHLCNEKHNELRRSIDRSIAPNVKI